MSIQPFNVLVSHGAHGTLFVQGYIDGVRVKKEYADGWTVSAAVGDFVHRAESLIYVM